MPLLNTRLPFTVLVTVLTLIATSSLAQQRQMQVIKHLALPQTGITVQAIDTLIPSSFLDTSGNCGQLGLLANQTGGYVVGNNTFGDKEKAQKYGITGQTTVDQVLVHFGAKQQSVTPGSLIAKVYSVDPATGAPHNLLGTSNAVSLANADTTFTGLLQNPTVFQFNNPVAVSDSFFAAIDFSSLAAGDTIGALSTAPDCYSGRQLAWEKQADDSWHAFNEGSTSWQLNIDLAFFPTITGVAGIGDGGPGFNLLSDHHATLENSIIHLQYRLRQRTDVLVGLYDLQGRLVRAFHYLAASPGKHHQHLTLPRNINSQILFYRIQTDFDAATGKLLWIR